MTSVLLATHPDLFAGGAVVAARDGRAANAFDEQPRCGHADPRHKTDFVTDVDLCATRHIARFWGLVP